MTSGLRIVAILAAYNEADIIEEALEHLISNGIDVHFIDNASTDETRQIAQAFLGRGVVAVEELPSVDGRFHWASILVRKQEIARSVEADWLIHQDADEFRESPWTGMRLAEAIGRVDAAGFNAIDFAVVDFWPTENDAPGNEAIRNSLTGFQWGSSFNRVQVRCWKKSAHAVDLVSSGGHDASFDDRRVFPLRFLLRHYPIRSLSQGRRKVQQERRPRFDSEELKRGWHVQYQAFGDSSSFIKEPASLTAFDPASVRAVVAIEDVVGLSAKIAGLRSSLEGCRVNGEALQHRFDLLSADCDEIQRRFEATNAQHVEVCQHLARELRKLQEERDGLVSEVQALYQSKTWRWTAPVRWMVDRVAGLVGRRHRA